MNNIDLERYTRQISLPEIGIDGQKKLSQTRVLIVGVGGLGSPISIYLTAAGVGTIGLIDNDVVSISNLHRQVLYGSSQVAAQRYMQTIFRVQSPANIDGKIKENCFVFEF